MTSPRSAASSPPWRKTEGRSPEEHARRTPKTDRSDEAIRLDRVASSDALREAGPWTVDPVQALDRGKTHAPVLARSAAPSSCPLSCALPQPQTVRDIDDLAARLHDMAPGMAHRIADASDGYEAGPIRAALDVAVGVSR